MVSAKGVVLRRYSDGRDRVLLCRNDRGEWELPGGRPEPGEDERAAVSREVAEETGQRVTVGALIDRFVLPIPSAGVCVPVAAYRCEVLRRGPLRLSDEHAQLAWLPVDALPGSVPDGYLTVIGKAVGGQQLAQTLQH